MIRMISLSVLLASTICLHSADNKTIYGLHETRQPITVLELKVGSASQAKSNDVMPDTTTIIIKNKGSALPHGAYNKDIQEFMHALKKQVDVMGDSAKLAHCKTVLHVLENGRDVSDDDDFVVPEGTYVVTLNNGVRKSQ